MVAFSTVVGISEFFVGNVVLSAVAGALAGNTVKDVMLKKGQPNRTYWPIGDFLLLGANLEKRALDGA